MALALATFEGREEKGFRLRIELGSNRMFTWSVGPKETQRKNGIPVIADPVYTSPLQGPVHEAAMGVVSVVVPSGIVDRENRFLQVCTFRNVRKEGSAISPILTLPYFLRGEEEAVPGVNFSKEKGMYHQELRAPDTIPMRIRELPYSRGMFFGALAGLIPQIAPIIGNFLGGITSGGGSGTRPAGGGAPQGIQNILQTLTDPAVLRQITALIQQISGPPAAAAPPPVPSPQSPPAAPAAQPSVAQPSARSLSRPGQRKKRYRMGFGLSHSQRRYSEAKVAPALLAALPALMPLLQQVLSPQTVQSVINAPNQHMQTAINGLKDLAQLGIQSHEQDLSHLRALNPGVNDAQLHELLMSMGLSGNPSYQPLRFKRAAAVSLDFTEIETVELFGKTKVLYSKKGRVSFPVKVETPREIPRAILEMTVKDKKSLDIITIKKTRLSKVNAGPLSAVPVLEAGEVAELPPGAYLICMALVWKNSNGENRGVSRHLEITLCDDVIFDRVEESNTLLPLADPGRFGTYWHKIWEGSFTEERKRFEFKVKYYTVLNTERSRNARTETKMKITATEERKVKGLMKVGMEYSLEDLNQLIPLLAPGTAMLTETELNTLKTGDFKERFNQAAQYNAEIRGRSGDTGLLWVYPEMKLQTLVLKTVQVANIHGLITGFGEKQIPFPLPVLIHFIGARTK